MNMTTMKWLLVCGLLNAGAIALVALLAVVSDLSQSVSLLIGALFVVASVVPFSKAQKAYATEKAAEATFI